MILSKDNNTLNLTASILSAKSMLQSKLDGIGIDVRKIENALNALQNEIVQLKEDVEETKEELVTTAEELKATTNNDKIKHLIDEVKTTLDEIEINDDILEGLCLSGCVSEHGTGGCNDSCFGTCISDHGTTGTSCDCYGYSEDDGWDCYMEWDNLCTSCFENGFDETCGLDYVNCGGNGYCLSGFITHGTCPLMFDDTEYCENDYQNDCINRFVEDSDKGKICMKSYSEYGLNCKSAYTLDDRGTKCTGAFDDHGTTCLTSYSQSNTNTECWEGFNLPDTKERCDDTYSRDNVNGATTCMSGYDSIDGYTCTEYFRVDTTGTVRCLSGYVDNYGDGSCEGGHTWQDDIGGSCESIFHNSTMNCQGGVAQDKTEERLFCNGDYDSGNINCHGGYGEDIDDQVTFCPHDFSDGYTTCRSGYMKQNGVETCTNKDPISCRGGCVSGYCDYCGGCVGNCDSCRGCHGSGNCSYTECEQCHGTTVTYPCGAQACGSYYDYCVAHSYGISWN